MNYSVESYINFCDDMQIAEEGNIFTAIKVKLVTAFSRLVLFIEKQVKKMKDGKIKAVLLKLLSRAKAGLAKSKSLNERNPEMVQALQNEAEEIQKEVDELNNVQQNQKTDLPDGKAMIIYSRTFNVDFAQPFLFYPNIAKEDVLTLKKEIVAASDLNACGDTKDVNHIQFTSKTGYCVNGVSGMLHVIANKFGVEVPEHYLVDRVGRCCVAFMGYISKDPVLISAGDVRMFFNSLNNVWDVKGHPLHNYKTEFR